MSIMPPSTGRPPNLSRPLPSSTRKALVRRLFKALLDRYGAQQWWPAETPWEMMIGALLTQNTSWTNVEKAITALKEADAMTPERIVDLEPAELERRIRPSGYFRQKALRLRDLARALIDDPIFFQNLNGTTPVSAADFSGLREKLLSLKGIGPETADAILLYAGGYPTFVVDAYTRRVGSRIGFLDSNNYDNVKSIFEQSMRADAETFNEYHALIVQLAKDICRKRAPRCEVCPVNEFCHYAKSVRHLRLRERAA